MNLSERLRQLIEAVTSPTRRFVALEEQTGVKAETWRTWWNRGGKASADLIQAAGQTWPEYAFWLITGVDDFYNGHTQPPTAKTPKGWERDAAKDVFLKKIEYERWRETADVNDATFSDDQKGFWYDIMALTEIRYSQEEVLTNLESKDKNRINRPDSPNI